MKKKLFTLIFSCLFILHATAQVTVTGSATKDGSYATLGAAISAIGTTTAEVSGRTISIAISASTAEAAAGISIGAGTWTSLTIFPTVADVVLSANVSSNALIQFSGAKNVTVDGRVNQAGARSMTLSNTGTTNATVNFTNAAQSNTVKYCTITGAGPTSKGLIGFGAVAATANGNGLNTLDHNLITNNGTRGSITVYSAGNATNPTVGNSFTNNEFKDCLKLNVACQIIGLTGNNSGWVITGNSFYDTGMIASAGYTATVVSIATGTGYTITDNYIGGNAASCAGTWTKTENNVNFVGINLSSATATGTSTIQNNTIKNFSWTNSGNGTWTGIVVGSASVATIDGNYIGDNTTNGSITTSNGAGSAVTGINITSTSAVDCINNKIGSITANSSGTPGFAVSINAINRGTQAANTNISNNTIGSSTASNSIYSFTNIGLQNVKGIVCTGTGTNTISNNEIGSLTNGSPGSAVSAIELGAGTNTVNANLIYNLLSPNSATTALNGINLLASGTNTCSNNIISLGNNYANTINGINEVASTTANNFYYNTIYITGAPTTLALNSFGISSASVANTRNIKNNIIWNNRVNAADATGKNYSIYLATLTTGTLGCDYNDLYVTSDAKNFVGKYGSSDNSDLVAWKAVSIAPDANSVSITPGFVNAGSKTAVDYKVSDSNLKLTSVISGITSDFGGVVSRSSTSPTIGAWEIDLGTALTNSEYTKLKIFAVNGSLKVSGVNAGQMLEVYNSVGQRITYITTVAGENNIKVNTKGLMIVKVGKLINKVVL